MPTPIPPNQSKSRYWWVNQNQTFRQEIDCGYMWSPKRKKNGHRNALYEFMREVAPGDIVFSFKDTFIQAIGVVTDICFEAPKPEEFGYTGTNWSQQAWMEVFQAKLTDTLTKTQYSNLFKSSGS